jgi:hypothetical protein
LLHCCNYPLREKPSGSAKIITLKFVGSFGRAKVTCKCDGMCLTF